MTGRPYILAETNWKQVRQTAYEVAVLPWGATEAHNYHLPYTTDNIEAQEVAIESARMAWERGAPVVVLPTIPFGVNSQQMDIPLVINMSPATQACMLEDVVRSLEPSSIRKLVVLNFHGGNDFRQMIRHLRAHSDLFLCAVQGWQTLPGEDYFDLPGDHAGEMETSLLMHLRPGWVLPLSEAGPGASRKFKVAGLNQPWAWAPREWTQVTKDTGVGDPAAATAEKGRRFFQATTRRIADFLVDLAAADPDAMYEDE